MREEIVHRYRGRWLIWVECPYCHNRQLISTVTFVCKYCTTRIDLRKLRTNLEYLIKDVFGPTGSETVYEKRAYVRRLLYGTANPLPW